MSRNYRCDRLKEKSGKASETLAAGGRRLSDIKGDRSPGSDRQRPGGYNTSFTNMSTTTVHFTTNMFFSYV